MKTVIRRQRVGSVDDGYYGSFNGNLNTVFNRLVHCMITLLRPSVSHGLIRPVSSTVILL